MTAAMAQSWPFDIGTPLPPEKLWPQRWEARERVTAVITPFTASRSGAAALFAQANATPGIRISPRTEWLFLTWAAAAAENDQGRTVASSLSVPSSRRGLEGQGAYAASKSGLDRGRALTGQGRPLQHPRQYRFSRMGSAQE